MRRKALGAILLPLPFAALPVIAVLLGAVFGPKADEQLVTRDVSTAVSIQERVLTQNDALETQIDGLAKVSSNSSYGSLGCEDHDVRSES